MPGAEVVVSLPLRGGPRGVRRGRAPGHAARRARGGARGAAAPPPSTTHPSRARPLTAWSGCCSPPTGPRPTPEAPCRLLSAGGERAEVELVAAEVLELLRGGLPAGEIAVVFREAAPYASLVEQVFAAYGIPFSLERCVPLGHTGARARGSRAAALRGPGGHRRRPARLPAHARPPRPAARGRPARARGPPARRPHGHRGARDLGARPLAARRDRPPGAGARRGRRSPCSSTRRSSVSSPARTSAPRTCSPTPSARTRARVRSSARR